MSDFGAGLIAGGCVILSVVLSVVEFVSYGHRQELIDLILEQNELLEELNTRDRRSPPMNEIPFEKPKGAGISTDNGQGLTEMPVCCQNFYCQRWQGQNRVAPQLVRNERGFMVCPRCCNSYGRG